MKKILSASLAFILIALTLTGCIFMNFTEQQTVSFYVDGELYSTSYVSYGQTVTEPLTPEMDNLVFTGWYSGSIRFNFATPIIADLELHARYALDAQAATRQINGTAARSTVTVHNKSYNTSMGGFIETESKSSQGSGVVIDLSNGYGYVLTNYHVIDIEDGFSNQKLSVEDPWGNTFDAQVYKHKNLTVQAADESYDLALIWFKYDKTQVKYELLEIAFGNDPEQYDWVISLGSPEGMQNSLTCGQVLTYKEITTDDNEEAAFESIIHNALINHGSSGGPLVDPEGKLVGLNFAGAEDLSYGCAIPVSKIHEFLNTYVYVD